MSTTLVWFRRDLRLADNPALAAAIARGGPVIPVLIWAPEEDGDWQPGAASRWWLDRSLASLQSDLAGRRSRLITRRGPTAVALDQLIAETGASAVLWNRLYEPASIARDTAIKTRLRERGIAAESFNANLLFEPWTIKNNSGQPFRVFTAFWNACLRQPIPPATAKTPRRIPAPPVWPVSLPLTDLNLQPKIDWVAGFRETWHPGESGARDQLKRFRKQALADYASGRDLPGTLGTSHLSPHLHFGEISPSQIWRAILDSPPGVADTYLRQLGWREFAHHILFHNPESPTQPLRREFANFPWLNDRESLRAWHRGQTGYPLVDAGMRELWHTGWMHNRVRMVVASFLVKHLLIAWQEGAKWFWDTLVDADLANNTLGWQWVAGCGADAAPYFRIFNPVLQGEKFDPSGDYVRRWVPEIAHLPNDLIHKPQKPIVDHDYARKRALAALKTI